MRKVGRPLLTPYTELRNALEHADDWAPDWARDRQVHRTEGTTIYTAAPTYLTNENIAELHTLAELGWSVHVDGPRLGRIRVQIIRQPTIQGIPDE